MQSIESVIDIPVNHHAASSALDLVLLYPGAIEGGLEQIIIDLVPQVVRRVDVHAWAFERTVEPAPVIALLLDVAPSALADIVDLCEDMLSSQLSDDAGLVMPSLVDMPAHAQAEQLPWGVRQSRIDAVAGAGKLRANMAQEQAVSEVVLAVVRNVRTNGWDRKTIAPTLLAELLRQMVGPTRVTVDGYRVMQHLLSDHPAGETLTRQFRVNGHKLIKAGVPILLRDSAHDAFLAELGTSIQHWRAGPDPATDISSVAAVWRRMASGIGFSTVEAAYLACLVASDGRGVQ